MSAKKTIVAGAILVIASCVVSGGVAYALGVRVANVVTPDVDVRYEVMRQRLGALETLIREMPEREDVPVSAPAAAASIDAAAQGAESPVREEDLKRLEELELGLSEVRRMLLEKAGATGLRTAEYLKTQSARDALTSYMGVLMDPRNSQEQRLRGLALVLRFPEDMYSNERGAVVAAAVDLVEHAEDRRIIDGVAQCCIEYEVGLGERVWIEVLGGKWPGRTIAKVVEVLGRIGSPTAIGALQELQVRSSDIAILEAVEKALASR